MVARRSIRLMSEAWTSNARINSEAVGMHVVQEEEMARLKFGSAGVDISR